MAGRPPRVSVKKGVPKKRSEKNEFWISKVDGAAGRGAIPAECGWALLAYRIPECIGFIRRFGLVCQPA